MNLHTAIAPGFAESAICNPLDFLRDAEDGETAFQLAKVMVKNFRHGTQYSQSDGFFEDTGQQLIQAVLQLAKTTDYPDLMMADALLGLSDLGKRIDAAQNLNPWVRVAFHTLLSVQDSEKTVGSIAGTASAYFSRFMKKSILAALCGQTTLPIALESHELLILGMDRRRRDVVAPLLAMILHMIVTHNVTLERDDPLIVALDELPTLYLPDLVQWINQNREDGLALILGFQNMAQLEHTYGKTTARSILGACGTKAIFNPQEEESARVFSQYLGKEEISQRRRSRSRGRGGGSTTISQDRQTRSLFDASQFLKLRTGECIFINPHVKNRREGYLPLKTRISIASRGSVESEKQSILLAEAPGQTGCGIPTTSDHHLRPRQQTDLG